MSYLENLYDKNRQTVIFQVVDNETKTMICLMNPGSDGTGLEPRSPHWELRTLREILGLTESE